MVKNKFLGYCKCGFMIGMSDLIKKTIYVCPSCNKRNKVKNLKQEKDKEFKPLTKKEYLEDVISFKNIYENYECDTEPKVAKPKNKPKHALNMDVNEEEYKHTIKEMSDDDE